LAMRTGTIDRHSFGKLSAPVDLPNLLAVQLHSYESFLQSAIPPSKRAGQGLQSVFQEIFPITDVHGNFTLEFIDYSIGQPKYSVDECKDRNMTYAASLKARLRLIIRDSESEEKRVKDIIEQSTYLGELPLITDRGTFIVNGAERVIVTQLHRSPGVFFDETIHPNGKRLYSARILPFRGSWLEFSYDVSDVMYVHIDRRRKQPVTVLLRAIGFSTNEEILALFHKNESIKVDEKAVGRTLAKPAIVRVHIELLACLGIFHHQKPSIRQFDFMRVPEPDADQFMSAVQQRKGAPPTRLADEIGDHKNQRTPFEGVQPGCKQHIQVRGRPGRDFGPSEQFPDESEYLYATGARGDRFDMVVVVKDGPDPVAIAGQEAGQGGNQID